MSNASLPVLYAESQMSTMFFFVHVAHGKNIVFEVIQNSLKTAHLVGYLPEYSANKIKPPKIIEKQVECFTIQEQKRIEEAALSAKKDECRGIILCLYTGLRIGELLALTWNDTFIL